jgi:hypothetical protein
MKKSSEDEKKRSPRIEIRPDLQDASKGRDLSYLNELPQMGRDEGVKAGVPPPPDKKSDGKDLKKNKGSR